MAKPKDVSIEIQLDRKLMPVAMFKELRYNKPIAAAYLPGEIIKGEVIVVKKSLDTTIIKANVAISFLGKADVHIVTERQAIYIPKGADATFRQSGMQFDYQGYTAIDVYFNREHVFLAADVKLPLGVSKYPFEFSLPEGDLIAPSFCGKHGDILYGMEARLETLGYDDVVSALPFIVTGSLRLSTLPDALQPLVVENEAYVCCKCCKNGPLWVQCTFPEKGILAGDFLEIDMQIDNKTTRKVDRILVEFFQNIRYSAGEHYRDEVVKLTETSLPGFKRKLSERRKRIRLFQVPHVQPTLSSGIIQITYQIIFDFDIAHSRNVKLECPMIVGSYR